MRGSDATDARAVRERARMSFAACQATGRPFGVLALAVDDRAILARVLGEIWIGELDAELLHRLDAHFAGQASALLAVEGRVLAYLPDADVARLTKIATGVLDGLAGWTRVAAGRERGVTVSLGLASSSAAEPRFDPRLVLEVLEGVASEGLLVAADAGGGRVAHSELYSFLQHGLERREPALLDAQARRVAAARPAKREATPAAPTSAAGDELSRDGSGAHAALRSAPAPPAGANEASAPVPRGPRPAPQPVERAGDVLQASFGDRLGAAVRELLRSATGGRADPLVERSLGALVEARLAEERRLARADADARYGHQVDLLERRLAKLNSALDETERELQRTALARAPDTGAPSAFRTVQGLAPDDSQFELKRQLMAEIFSANLELARRRAQ